MADAIVQLVNDKGKIIKETRTAYDGFYLIDFVTPGGYTLRIDPEQISRLKLDEPEQQSIKIEGDGTIINIDIPLVGVKLLSLVHDNEDDNKTTTPCSDCITATLTVKVGN